MKSAHDLATLVRTLEDVSGYVSGIESVLVQYPDTQQRLLPALEHIEQARGFMGACLANIREELQEFARLERYARQSDTDDPAGFVMRRLGLKRSTYYKYLAASKALKLL